MPAQRSAGMTFGYVCGQHLKGRDRPAAGLSA